MIRFIKFNPIWSIVFVLISIDVANGRSKDEVTTVSVDHNEIVDESSSSETSLPKVQTRFFNWLMNGLTGQSNGALGGLLRPNSGPPFNRFESSTGSGFGANDGFGMRPLANGQSMMNQVNRPSMGQRPMMVSSSSMNSPSMSQSPTGMSSPTMGQMPMGPPQMPMGSQSPMSPQTGMGSNYAGNGQLGGQMNQLSQLGDQMDGMPTDDPYGDYGGGGDIFTSIFTFLFGPSGNSGSNRGRETFGQGGQGQKGRPSSGSGSGMTSEDWSNYFKMIQTLYANDGGGSGGAGLGDLSSIIGQATSLIQSFQGS